MGERSCHNCGEPGHFSRECQNQRRGGGGGRGGYGGGPGGGGGYGYGGPVYGAYQNQAYEFGSGYEQHASSGRPMGRGRGGSYGHGGGGEDQHSNRYSPYPNYGYGAGGGRGGGGRGGGGYGGGGGGNRSCYNCGAEGHMSRNCTKERSGGYGGGGRDGGGGGGGRGGNSSGGGYGAGGSGGGGGGGGGGGDGGGLGASTGTASSSAKEQQKQPRARINSTELNKIIDEKAGELKDYGYNMELTLGFKFAEFLKGLTIEATEMEQGDRLELRKKIQDFANSEGIKDYMSTEKPARTRIIICMQEIALTYMLSSKLVKLHEENDRLAKELIDVRATYKPRQALETVVGGFTNTENMSNAFYHMIFSNNREIRNIFLEHLGSWIWTWKHPDPREGQQEEIRQMVYSDIAKVAKILFLRAYKNGSGAVHEPRPDTPPGIMIRPSEYGQMLLKLFDIIGQFLGKAIITI